MKIPHVLIFSWLAACGGDSTPDGASDPNAPTFLSFGASAMSMTEGETVTFSAVVTDPDGIDDLIGGALFADTEESVQLGAFATSGQEGAYSLSISWQAIHQSADLTFAKNDSRTFRAVFFDAAGHRAQRDVTIAFSCPEMACHGECASTCDSDSTERQSCDAVCAAQNPAMTCEVQGVPDSLVYRPQARYSSTSGSIFSLDLQCGDSPPAQHPDISNTTFARILCACTL